jgi:6-phosphogluconolactonase
MHRFVKDHRFPNATALAHALAGEIRVDLQEAIEARGSASLVVSGGRTPIPLFQSLSTEAMDWSRVWISLVDERWIAPDHESSNERLMREHLLVGPAAKAHFIGLKNPSPVVDDGIAWSWKALGRMARPFDVVVLGMGDDGHTASLFPSSAGLSQALETTAPPACVAMNSPSAPHARVSLNLAAILDARRIILHIVGASKWQVYQRAREAGPVESLPVRGVIHQQRVPVDVFWSP